MNWKLTSKSAAIAAALLLLTWVAPAQAATESVSGTIVTSSPDTCTVTVKVSKLTYSAASYSVDYRVWSSKSTVDSAGAGTPWVSQALDGSGRTVSYSFVVSRTDYMASNYLQLKLYSSEQPVYVSYLATYVGGSRCK